MLRSVVCHGYADRTGAGEGPAKGGDEGGMMTQTLKLAAGLCLAAMLAQAETVAPTNVAFDDYGDVAESLTGVPGNPENGAVLMDRGSGNCIACHAVTALEHLPFHGDVGPSLDGVAERWSEASLRGILVNAKNVFPDTIMPSFYFTGPYIRPGDAYTGKAHEGDLQPLLTAQDIEDVLSYLMTLDTYYD